MANIFEGAPHAWVHAPQHQEHIAMNNDVMDWVHRRSKGLHVAQRPVRLHGEQTRMPNGALGFTP